MCGQVWYESGSDRLLGPLMAVRGFVGLCRVRVLRPPGAGLAGLRREKRREKGERREKERK